MLLSNLIGDEIVNIALVVDGIGRGGVETFLFRLQKYFQDKTSTPFEVDYSHVKTDKAAWWTTDTELTAEGKAGENIIEVSVHHILSN